MWSAAARGSLAVMRSEITSLPQGAAAGDCAREPTHGGDWAAPDLERLAPSAQDPGRPASPPRAAILLALTGAALAAPWPLRRRGLGGSAESVAAIGLALTMLDAFLSYQLLLAGTTVS